MLNPQVDNISSSRSLGGCYTICLSTDTFSPSSYNFVSAFIYYIVPRPLFFSIGGVIDPQKRKQWKIKTDIRRRDRGGWEVWSASQNAVSNGNIWLGNNINHRLRIKYVPDSYVFILWQNSTTLLRFSLPRFIFTLHKRFFFLDLDPIVFPVPQWNPDLFFFI